MHEQPTNQAKWRKKVRKIFLSRVVSSAARGLPPPKVDDSSALDWLREEVSRAGGAWAWAKKKCSKRGAIPFEVAIARKRKKLKLPAKSPFNQVSDTVRSKYHPAESPEPVIVQEVLTKVDILKKAEAAGLEDWDYKSIDWSNT